MQTLAHLYVAIFNFNFKILGVRQTENLPFCTDSKSNQVSAIPIATSSKCFDVNDVDSENMKKTQVHATRPNHLGKDRVLH